MKLIVGLGNPGAEYDDTRHNIGFAVLDRFADRTGVLVQKEKFQSCYGTGKIGDEPILLVKPQTFMNLSGKAVRSFLDYWKLSTKDLLVLHDDLDFPLGSIRLVYTAGAAGHRGTGSIIEELATKSFYRLRLGIGRPERGDPVNYVLSRFGKDEKQDVERLIDRAAEAVNMWLTADPEQVQKEFHTKN